MSVTSKEKKLIAQFAAIQEVFPVFKKACPKMESGQELLLTLRAVIDAFQGESTPFSEETLNG